MTQDRTPNVARSPSQAEIERHIAYAHRLRAQAAHAGARKMGRWVAAHLARAGGRVRPTPERRPAAD